MRQWTGPEIKAHKDETPERGIGPYGGESLRGEWKGDTIREEDCATDVDAKQWVWLVVIMGRRMAAAEHCRSYPKDDDAEAPVKT